jgi:hypothetical protein
VGKWIAGCGLPADIFRRAAAAFRPRRAKSSLGSDAAITESMKTSENFTNLQFVKINFNEINDIREWHKNCVDLYPHSTNEIQL